MKKILLIICLLFIMGCGDTGQTYFNNITNRTKPGASWDYISGLYLNNPRTEILFLGSFANGKKYKVKFISNNMRSSYYVLYLIKNDEIIGIWKNTEL